MTKVLHFSPVRKPPEILSLHLRSLKELEQTGIDLTFSFFDDNVDIQSTRLLIAFTQEIKKSLLLEFEIEGRTKPEEKKRWSRSSYSRIAAIKNAAIEYFLKRDYDFLFLTDSDLLIHPKTLENLIDKNKDFCATIFWTHFEGSATYTPNAWFAKFQGFSLDDLKRLRSKGTFPVDYTGACTLLSRKILENGVSFKKIPSLHYLGEDKHFCVRASVHGFQPYVDTAYPAFHLYHDSLIDQGKVLVKNNFDNLYLKEWLGDEWEKKLDYWLHPPQKSVIAKIFSKLKPFNG